MVATCKMLIATSLLLGLAVSHAADPSRQSDCQLPAGTFEAEWAIPALATLNTLCPIGAGNPAQGSVCLPCVCGALNLFHEALAKSTSANQRSGTSNALGVPETADMLNTCIHAHATKFLEPLKVKAGLIDCLSSQGLFSDSTKLAAMCSNYNTKSAYGENFEVNAEEYEADDSSITLSTVEADSNAHHVGVQTHRRMQQQAPPPPVASGPPPDAYSPPPDAYSPPPGAYTPPSPDSYTPPSPDSYTPPSPDAYTPPSPGAYTPPSPGAYTPPSPGAYTPPSPDAYGPPSPDAFGPPVLGGVYPPGFVSPPYPPTPPGVGGVYGSPAPPYGPGTGGIITGPPPSASTPPSPDAYTPPSPDAYTPPSPGAYTPPSPGAYTPPSPGDYTPPSPGAYTPPSPGGDSTPPSPGNQPIGASPPNSVNAPPGVQLAPPPRTAAGLTTVSLLPLAVALLCAFLMGAMVM